LNEQARHSLSIISEARGAWTAWCSTSSASRGWARRPLPHSRSTRSGRERCHPRAMTLRPARRRVASGPAPRREGDRPCSVSFSVNLLSNAHSVQPARSAHAVGEVGHRVEEDGTTGRVRPDNGVGFDMAYANKLFGRLRAFATAPMPFPDTGSVLATSGGVITRHGGKHLGRGDVEASWRRSTLRPETSSSCFPSGRHIRRKGPRDAFGSVSPPDIPSPWPSR